jgi:hypothetical protein
MPDGTDRTYPPSGKVARVVSYEIAAGNFAGIPTVHRRLGAVEGLPPDGEPCLVSALGAVGPAGRHARRLRADTGATALRDAAGHVVAVTRLVMS